MDDILEDKTEGELFMTGLKIRQLIDEKFMIYDKKMKKNRPIEYRDIVLLTPTKKNNLTILEIFKTFDIPLEMNDAQNYFQATEIRTMVSLLQLIDNPYQDIPLASVLRSPIVGLIEPELARIRLADRSHTYYEAVLAYQAEHTDELADKLNHFGEQLEIWRELSPPFFRSQTFMVYLLSDRLFRICSWVASRGTTPSKSLCVSRSGQIL